MAPELEKLARFLSEDKTELKEFIALINQCKDHEQTDTFIAGYKKFLELEKQYLKDKWNDEGLRKEYYVHLAMRMYSFVRRGSEQCIDVTKEIFIKRIAEGEKFTAETDWDTMQSWLIDMTNMDEALKRGLPTVVFMDAEVLKAETTYLPLIMEMIGQAKDTLSRVMNMMLSQKLDLSECRKLRPYISGFILCQKLAAQQDPLVQKYITETITAKGIASMTKEMFEDFVCMFIPDLQESMFNFLHEKWMEYLKPAGQELTDINAMKRVVTENILDVVPLHSRAYFLLHKYRWQILSHNESTKN